MRAVVLVGDAGAVPVGVGDVVEGATDAGDHVGDGRDVGRVVGLDEHGLLFVTEAEPSARGVGVGVVDRDEPGDGLLLEPLPGVSGCDRGAGRQVVDGHLAGVTDGVVEPEAAPEVDAEHLERPDGRFEQSGVERGGGVGRFDDGGVCGQGRGRVRCHATIGSIGVGRALGGCLRIG